jgi:PAS domain S-box-containing protein
MKKKEKTTKAKAPCPAKKQKKAEDELRESEANYRQRVETTHDLIMCVDLDFKVTYVNKAITTLVGEFDPIGKNLLDYTSPDWHEFQKAIMQKRREGFSDMLSFEWTLLYPFGSTMIFDIKSTLLTDDGKPSGVMFVARDITKRKQAEKALQESEQKYKSLIENIPDIIFTIDLEGKITFASKKAKEILGYEEAEAINTFFFDYIPEEDRQKALEDMHKGMKGEKMKHIEIPIIAKSGEKLFFDCSFTEFIKMEQ